MTAQQRIDDILNECIDRLARGETVEACLARYPEHAPELRPLLLVARATLSATAQITPRAEFRMAARHRFLDALAARHAREREPFLSGPWLRKWGAVAAGVTLLVVIGSGTVAAAETSLPSEPLYTVKQATEAFQVALAPEGSAKAKVYAQLAARRLDEISVLARQGDVQSVDQLASQFEVHLDNATLAVSQTSPERLTAPESVPAPSAAPAAVPVTATPLPSVSPAQVAQPSASPTPAAAAIASPATPTPSVSSPQTARPTPSPTPRAAAVARPADPAATPTPVARQAPTATPVIRRPAATEKAPVKAVKPAARPSAQNLRDIHTILKKNAEQQIAVLKKSFEEAPPSARPALEKALEQANRKYAQVIRALERLEEREQEREREDRKGR